MRLLFNWRLLQKFGQVSEPKTWNSDLHVSPKCVDLRWYSKFGSILSYQYRSKKPENTPKRVQHLFRHFFLFKPSILRMLSQVADKILIILVMMILINASRVRYGKNWDHVDEKIANFLSETLFNRRKNTWFEDENMS